MKNIGEIILYQPDETIKVEVRVENETVWLTQAQIAQLFGVDRTVITKHLRNIFNGGELDEDGTCAIFAHMGNDGKQRYRTKYYNLDGILSIGYRVNSMNATQFRRWATHVLKEYMLKGFAINQHIERIESFAIDTAMRVTEIEKKINFLKQYVEDVLADNNDINEDTRMQLELISEEIARLQSGIRFGLN
jgi:hypothetical protein